jgi:hypothetical protein
MAPELLRHSDAPEKAARFAPHLRDAHRPSAAVQPAPQASAAAAAPSPLGSLWDAEDARPAAGDKRARGDALDLDADDDDDAGLLLDDALGDFL